MTFQTINPATEEVIKEYEEFTAAYVDRLLENAYETHQKWRLSSFEHRSRHMEKAAQILLDRKDKLALLMADEMGKPLAQGAAEVEKCAWVCRYYAENAEAQLDDLSIPTEMNKSYVSFKPLGVVLAIMPWNFPLWQVFRFAAPSLMAGNCGVLKHSRNTMGCAIEIERIFRDAEFPPGAFTNLIIGSAPVAKIIESGMIAAVTLTGSTPVGQKVAEKAGSVLKKTVLELGGSDPYVVLKDADLEFAAETCVAARLINSGQSCIAAKRFIVEADVCDEFTELFVKKMSEYKMGSPTDESVKVGPQARKDLQIDLQSQVDRSVEAGAEILLGGKLPEGKGWFYPPTVLTNVKKGAPAYSEEIFGPVAAIIRAVDESDAIRIANDVSFGLGAAIFTGDAEHGEWIAREKLEAGACFVNDFVKSDPRLPFGGIKESGYGRELSAFGIREFVNIKTVCVK